MGYSSHPQAVSGPYLVEFFAEYFLFQYADDAVISGGATMG